MPKKTKRSKKARLRKRHTILSTKLKRRQAKKSRLEKRMESLEDEKQLEDLEDELDEVLEEIAELEEQIEAVEEIQEEQEAELEDIEEILDEELDTGLTDDPETQEDEDETRSAPRTRAVNGRTPSIVRANARGQCRRSGEETKHSTLEYRRAFMDYARGGEMAPILRADAKTTTGDASAVIPTTILDEIVRRLESYGEIYSRVRHLNIKGGVEIPILKLKPTATWITEAKTSDRQKVQANQSVIFSYFGLECKVSTSILADTVTLDSFETTIIDLIFEAIMKKLDEGVVNGTGSGQMLGITNDTRVPATQIVTLTAAEFTSWESWKKKVFAKMPKRYKAGAEFMMASGTFEGYIDGMVDGMGQPIGRVNYGITAGPANRFGGKEVLEVEDDIIAPYDDAAVGDVIAIYWNPKDYGINSNMELTMFNYYDHDENEKINKALLIADGKLIDPNGVVIIKKG